LLMLSGFFQVKSLLQFMAPVSQSMDLVKTKKMSS
jgi:hypothetical protein